MPEAVVERINQRVALPSCMQLFGSVGPVPEPVLLTV
jgi:hypothetical protein